MHRNTWQICNVLVTWFWRQCFSFQIHLDHNEIVELAPNTFSDMHNLTLVNLTSNSLQGFHRNALALDIKHDEDQARVYLDDNPLVCDCDMEWFQRAAQISSSSPRYDKTPACLLFLYCSKETHHNLLACPWTHVHFLEASKAFKLS